MTITEEGKKMYKRKEVIVGLLIGLMVAISGVVIAEETKDVKAKELREDINNPYQSDERTVLLLHFDEGEGAPNDSSKNGNNCSFRGEVIWSKEGKFGSCVSFNGLNGHVRVENNDVLNLGKGDATIECWLKLKETGDTQFVVFKGGYDAKRAGYCLQVHGKTGQLLFQIGDGTTRPTAMSKTSVTDDTWHHVACVIDRTGALGTPNTQYLFIDGIQEGVAGTPEGSIDSGFLLSFGSDGGSSVVNGLVDEVRISNCVRRYGK